MIRPRCLINLFTLALTSLLVFILVLLLVLVLQLDNRPTNELAQQLHAKIFTNEYKLHIIATLKPFYAQCDLIVLLTHTNYAYTIITFRGRNKKVLLPIKVVIYYITHINTFTYILNIIFLIY